MLARDCLEQVMFVFGAAVCRCENPRRPQDPIVWSVDLGGLVGGSCVRVVFGSPCLVGPFSGGPPPLVSLLG